MNLEKTNDRWVKLFIIACVIITIWAIFSAEIGDLYRSVIWRESDETLADNTIEYLADDEIKIKKAKAFNYLKVKDFDDYSSICAIIENMEYFGPIDDDPTTSVGYIHIELAIEGKGTLWLGVQENTDSSQNNDLLIASFVRMLGLKVGRAYYRVDRPILESFISDFKLGNVQ